MGSTSISSLRYKLGLDSLPSIAVTEVARIQRAETGGRPVVDVRLIDTISGPAALAINDEGMVFQSNVASNTNAMYVFCFSERFHILRAARYPIYQSSEVRAVPPEAFWRLAVGTTPSTCYIVSSYQIQQLDLRVRLQV